MMLGLGLGMSMLRRSAPAWTPADLAPGVLLAWFGGRSLGELAENSDGTGAVVDASRVGRWRDLAAGKHLVQTTSGDRPVAGYSALGRGFAVFGNGTSHFLAATSSTAGAVTCFAAISHVPPPLVVCDGDSLVAGNGVLTTEAWPSLLWERYGATVDVVNLGIPGRTAQQIRAAGVAPYAALARQASRRVLVLAAGINDLRAGRTPVDVWQDLSEHALAAQAAGWAVVLCTLAPSPDTETTHPGAIDALNDLILAGCTGRRADLQPVTSLLPDGLHYDDAGQADAAARIGTVVDDALS